MKVAPKLSIALLCVALVTACPSDSNPNSNANSANQNTNTVNANSIKDDIDELEMTVKLPFRPEESVWFEQTLGKPGENRVPAPTDKKLTAVLLFKKQDADRIVAQAEKIRPPAPETINPEKWFPAELIAQSRVSGNETLKGASYPANDFFNPPYGDGKITRVEGTDYFILELFAK